MTERRQVDPWSLMAATAVLAMGVGVVWHGRGYDIGTAAAMGSGFYPVLLGVLLVGLAVLNMFEVIARSERMVEFRFRPFLTISISLCAFAYLVRPFGLVPATFALVAIASLAEQKPKPLMALFTAVFLSVFGAVIFVYALRVPLPIMRW